MAAASYQYETEERVPRGPKRKKKKNPRSRLKLVECIFLFAVMVGISYGVSVLVGQSLAAKQSKEAMSYGIHRKAAVADIESLKSKLDRNANPARVAGWARSNGFDRTNVTDGKNEESQQ